MPIGLSTGGVAAHLRPSRSYALFRDPALNAQLRRVLTYWSGFLSGPYSRTHLNCNSPNAWFSAEADAHDPRTARCNAGTSGSRTFGARRLHRRTRYLSARGCLD
ncbi:phophatidylserine decarboxylase associated domain-containing protein [Paraburkholderia hospita]|uniref:phophatidylserine decarboxylase associated domain-containing protein n=1 Tax=Paraburkholderia hospita TaxID=169430 RepID=UPI003F4F4358